MTHLNRIYMNDWNINPLKTIFISRYNSTQRSTLYVLKISNESFLEHLKKIPSKQATLRNLSGEEIFQMYNVPYFFKICDENLERIEQKSRVNLEIYLEENSINRKGAMISSYKPIWIRKEQVYEKTIQLIITDEEDFYYGVAEPQFALAGNPKLFKKKIFCKNGNCRYGTVHTYDLLRHEKLCKKI